MTFSCSTSVPVSERAVSGVQKPCRGQLVACGSLVCSLQMGREWLTLVAAQHAYACTVNVIFWPGEALQGDVRAVAMLSLLVHIACVLLYLHRFAQTSIVSTGMQRQGLSALVAQRWCHVSAAPKLCA